MTLPVFRVVIPARWASSRFPGKALAPLGGVPMVCRVWQQARASGACDVLVATDDERIAAAVVAWGGEVVMTDAAHRSGTERVAEVAARRGWPDDDIVVNCQGDVPLVPPQSIVQVASALASGTGSSIATLCTPIGDERQYLSPHVVKVVCDQAGRALYFSRAPIPARGHGSGPLPRSLRHIGLYAYRVGALRRLATAPPCELEQAENLEQLRALWLGMVIVVAETRHAHGPDVDTPDDLAAAHDWLCDERG